MKIIATYIFYSQTEGYFYKLHECIGINNFNRNYYTESNTGEIEEMGYDKGKDLIESYGK